MKKSPKAEPKMSAMTAATRMMISTTQPPAAMAAISAFVPAMIALTAATVVSP